MPVLKKHKRAICGSPFLFAHLSASRHNLHMMEQKPWLWIIAGPNGAGKTTFATQALRDNFKLEHFVNTDEIARLLSSSDPNEVLMRSGRLMLKEFDKLRSERVSFAIETTLSSSNYLVRAKAMQSEDWRIGMVYVWLNSPELSRERVCQRVARGGHDVPEDIIFRRYVRSMNNIVPYFKACEKVFVYDNSKERPELVGYRHKERFVPQVDHKLGLFIQKQLTER